ncbi:hypothetical protein ACOMHN_028223 [Nucella lapillus]
MPRLLAPLVLDMAVRRWHLNTLQGGGRRVLGVCLLFFTVVMRVLGVCLLFFTVVIPETEAVCQLGDDVIRLTSWRGQLQSPGLTQGQYPSNQHCRWVIKVSQGSRVKVTFLTFDLEAGYYKNSSPSAGENLMWCNDVVKIEEEWGIALFEGCQSQGQGRTFEASGNSLSVSFLSDESGEKSGFKAIYEGVCQATLSQPGVLESPGYPQPPPEGVGCRWEVTSVQSQILYIRPEDQNGGHPLPDCGATLINWKTSSASPKEKELCRADSKIVTQSDVIVTYQPTPTNAWTGRLLLNYSTQSGCKQYCDHGFDCLNSRSGDIGDYRCLCKAPYALGHNCEIYTSPCLAHNCSGAGACTPVTDSVNFTCDCHLGYSGPRCEVTVDPCQNVACLHGGTCRWDQQKGEVGCVCSAPYTGTRCSIPLGEGHCKAEVDNTPGSGISWADTLAGHHDNQPCPDGVRGRAQRHCMSEERSPTRAVWKRPDLSDCVSPRLYNLTLQARTLRQAGTGGDLLYNVTRRLDTVTSEMMTSGGVYPGDLLGASDVLADISQGVMTASSVHQSMAQHFTSSIGNILHPATLHVWSNARVHLVENKVASILTSAQHFAQNLVQRQLGQNVISGLTSSPDNFPLLSSAADNVELVVSEWGEGDDNASWTPPFPLPSTPPTLNASTSTLSLLPRASFSLPPDLLRIARADGSGRRMRVYTGRFSSIGQLLSLEEHRYTREGEVGERRVVNSDVISAVVLDLPPSSFPSLTHPVILTFPLTDPNKSGDLKKYCMFMNMTASGPADRWLREGCYAFQSNHTHVTCYCFHLTNFAVLLDVYGQADQLDSANSAALSYISYIGASLSILCCVVVIVVFEFFRLRSERIRIHEQLAVSIIFVQVLFFIGVALSAREHPAPKWGCRAVAVCLHYALTALFCWMMVEGVHLYLQLVRVFKQPSHLAKYCAVGWGVPFIVVGISVGVFFDKYGENDVCWLSHEVLMVAFVPTVSLVVTINVVILVMVVRVMLGSLRSTARANNPQHSSLRSSLKACVVLLPLLGVTWVFGLVAVDCGDSGRVTVYLFTYLFTIANSAQGLLFFLFHCLLNVDVHNAYERKYRQRKRSVSYMETQTRKNSETSTYLADSSPRGNSTTKTILSDLSLTSEGKPGMTRNRFLLFDRRLTPDLFPDPSSCDPDPDGCDPDLDPISQGMTRSPHQFPPHADVNGYGFDDMQVDSDTERIWRRHSVNHGDTQFTNPALSLSPAYPSSPLRDVTDFVTSMHNVLDGRPTRNSVRFAED